MVKIDWDKLTFKYMRTNSHIEYSYKDGSWSAGQLIEEPFINISIAASTLHYGQELFEGMKAFTTSDDRICIFRPKQNFIRLNETSKYICMPDISEEMYFDALNKVIKANSEYVPPYGTGGSLYIRPLLIGTGPVIGVEPSGEYKFIVMVMPVGAYYKNGLKTIDAVILDDYDRTAPNGSGRYKIGGNYAASLFSSKVAKHMGFPAVLFLDPKEHKYIDEFSTSNFFAITKDGKYVTPESKSILPSVTNISLMQLAEDLGIKVERRPIEFDELSTFAEVGACGTAVVITPIRKIVRGDREFYFGEECGPTSRKLYETLTSLQIGNYPDKHNWLKQII